MKRMILLLVLFVIPAVSFAQVKITEIFYDAIGSDQGREWIEIQNISQNPLDLSKFKLFESGTNHGLVAFANATTSPGEYVLVVSNPDLFKQDNPNFSGLVFDSSFSLSNTGESLSIKNSKGEIVDSVTYKSEGESGASLQYVESAWRASKPTPGAENKVSAVQKNVATVVDKPTATVKPKATKDDPKAQPLPVKTGLLPKKMIVPVEELPSNEKSNLLVYILGLTGIISAGLFGVYLLENKGQKEVLEKKELSAEDFEIIEDKDNL